MLIMADVLRSSETFREGEGNIRVDAFPLEHASCCKDATCNESFTVACKALLVKSKVDLFQPMLLMVLTRSWQVVFSEDCLLFDLFLVVMMTSV